MSSCSAFPFDFFVYSTKIFQLARDEPPLYGSATVLASLTLVTLAVIIPFQRWILHRQRYTTISGSFKPGLINLGKWKWVVFGAIAFLILGLTIVPAAILGLGSFMTRAGFFNLNNVYTLRHWDLVLTDSIFIKAIRTTFTIAIVAAFLQPTDLLRRRLHPGAYTVGRTWAPGYSHLGIGGRPRNPDRSGAVAGYSSAPLC